MGEEDPVREQQEKKPAAGSAEVDNGVGSYERFMMSFGSPARWAGR